MSDRIVVRVFATIVLTALAIVAGMYFLNPLRTASHDPRLRVTGYTVFRTPSRAMEPTIHLNEKFVVSAWPYRYADPTHGDLIVFQYPLDPSTVYIKRVIAAFMLGKSESTRKLYDLRSVMVHTGRGKDDWTVDGAKRSAYDLVEAGDVRCAQAIRKFLDLGSIPDDWRDTELS